MSQNNTTTELALVLTEGQIVTAFKSQGLEDILKGIEAAAKEFAADPSTEKGRREIASMAYKIARTKTAIDEQGKRMTEEQRALIDAINADRRKARERLDNLKDEVRQPLTEFENREKERIAGHTHAVNELKQPEQHEAVTMLTDELQGELESIERLFRNREWEEFGSLAKRTFEETRDRLKSLIAQREKEAAEKAELERLRKEAEERERKEREAQIAKEAEERALKQAEEAARKEREESERRAKAEAKRIEDERRKEREEYARKEREAREKEERLQREKAEAEERAKREVEEANRRAKEEAERKESERIEAERKAKEAEAKRQANADHRKRVKIDAYHSLVDAAQVDGETAKRVLAAIDAGRVKHVTINY